MPDTHAYPRAGASVVVFRGDSVLLVQRSKRLYEGFWSFPGGEVQWGETSMDAARRELQEETGLLASTLTLGDVADGIVKDDQGVVIAHYTIVVFVARDIAGEPVAASDAARAAYFGPEERQRLQRTPGLETVIENARLALEKGGR
jgi:8-oxo-dGTP diphosphatase